MPIKTKISILALTLAAIIDTSAIAAPSLTSITSGEPITQETESESEKANALFETIFMENVMQSPISQTHLGIKNDYGKWDQRGEEADARSLARTERHLTQLKQINVTKLNEQTRLSFNLLKQKLKQEIDDYQWRFHNYPVNQMHGGHTMIASFLINQHQIDNQSDAEAYISRLKGVPEYLNQLERALEIRAEKGIIAPRFVFPHVLSGSKNIIRGAPFDSGEDSAIWADFKRKVELLEIESKDKNLLLSDARQALLTRVKPAYEKLIIYIAQLETKADSRDGVWKFPQGEQYYNNALARTTTTGMTAEQIHELGLKEVARIHNEMRGIMKQVNFEGDLTAFFKFMREDKQFYYPATDEGRNAYLNQAITLIETISSRLDEVFNVKPQAPMIVKRVEAFREKSAGKAFYNQPTPDGSRPGTYYANLYDMQAMPKYQMEALAYHEGTPGHHMQIAIAQELEGVPKFRKFGGVYGLY